MLLMFVRKVRRESEACIGNVGSELVGEMKMFLLNCLRDANDCTSELKDLALPCTMLTVSWGSRSTY